ncbi:MAG: hypothetical protein JRN45_00600 [Nitrososphaerota archaeon]|nr:hypothetical protein [Nitrososphaerota archaeon]
MFRVSLAPQQVLERLAGHAKFVQRGWHDLYEIDDYAVRALEALSWFELNDTRDWMPKAVRGSIGPYQFDPEVILKLKAAYEDADKAAEVFKPQEEWGVFSETLVKTIKGEFLKARLKGENADADAFYEKACRSFRTGLKLAPFLKQLYELGYCSTKDGLLFLAHGNNVSILKGDAVADEGVDGTTGSVREAMRRLRDENAYFPLKYFHRDNPEIFERMKEKDPELYYRLAVKILFR